VARVTDRSGAVVWQAGQSAFGGAAPLLQQIMQPLRFAGQYHDAETGLHYNRYRYYDPALGRYITRDPMGITQGLNVYCYSGNDPIGRSDPMGLWGWPSWKTVAKVAAVVAVGIAVTAAVVVAAPFVIGAAAAASVVGAAAVTITAGAAGMAAAFGLNEALNQEVFCAKCILMAAGKGFIIGGLTAAAFLALPASAGVAAFAAMGAATGLGGYALDHAMTPDHKRDWNEALLATGIGAMTAGAGRAILGPKSALPPRQQSPFTERYLEGSGGRWGLPSTRRQNYELGQQAESRGGTVTHGGGIAGEEYIPGVGPGTKGSTYPDITVRNADGTTTRIQTVDMETNPAGQRVPTQRDLNNAQSIRDAFPDDELILVPKE
jgi:RHS repeat-associated protein